MIDFSNFHDQTIASFKPCATPAPERPADFSSDSGSLYWDVGTGVVRASDHWAGHNGCDGQRSCIWKLEAPELDWGAQAAGYCAFDGFQVRRLVPVWHEISIQDKRMATILKNGGGALPASDWVTGAGRRTSKMPVPCWASEALRTSSGRTKAAKTLFAARPRVQKVITAPPEVLSRILSDRKRLKIGEELEKPPSSFWELPEEEIAPSRP